MACKFAPVAPIQVLEQMYEHHPKVFGDYHLLLAHHTVAEADRFRRLFERIAADDLIHPTVIMDNSVVECGGSVDFDMMQKACATISEAGHDVIPVLPDVMGKGKETREATKVAYDKWDAEIPCAGFMAVAQGENWDDFCDSVAILGDRGHYPHTEFIGVPRLLVKTLGTRRRVTHQAITYATERHQKIHLLGYSDDTVDDLLCSLIPGVHGIDSAVPLRVDGQFSFGADYEPRPKNWFDIAQFSPLMGANLAFVRQQHSRNW